MRVIIAGGRDIELELSKMESIIRSSGFVITQVVSGKATHGELWAKVHNIPVASYPADWNDLGAPDAVIKKNKWGQAYNAKAGHDRNLIMAQNADALIAVWDGKSKGTQNMIQNAKKLGLKVFIYRYE